MKHKVVVTKQGKVVVDETAEIKDYYVNEKNKLIYSETHPKRLEIINLGNKRNRSALIATINHSISLDVPMITVEDNYNMEKDWGNLRILKMVCESNGIGNAYYKEKARLELKYERLAFKAGYKARGGFSEEIVRQAFKEGVLMPNRLIKDIDKIEEAFIQSLKQEYIEVEMEQLNNKPSSSYSTETIYKLKTTRDENGQLIAYQKITV
jgi:hypothetical protein